MKYGITQMQLHTHACVLASPHAHANMCPVTSDGTLMSLTVHACYMKGCTHVYAARVDTYIGTYVYATRMSPMCIRQSLRRIVSQGAYSSDIISSYSQ